MVIATADGPLRISEIEIGDAVLAYDEATGAVDEYTVTDTSSHWKLPLEMATRGGTAITHDTTAIFNPISQSVESVMQDVKRFISR